MSIVVSDTSPLHYLIQCEAVHLLPALFQGVLIPPAVFRELQHSRTPATVRAWAQALPPWIKVQSPRVVDSEINADEGEREAISLACEIGASAILMDDRKGRAEASRFGLRVTGTLGLLEIAAIRGLIDLPKVMGLLQKTNARLDPELIQSVMRRADRTNPGTSS